MKKVLILCAATALVAAFATSAFASGCDLTVLACPGNAGAAADAGSLDCAGGGVLSLDATFLPAGALPDLAGIDIVFDIAVAGDVNSDANFWDFATANAAAVGSSQIRPAAGCVGYTATWSPSGSGAGSLGVAQSPSHMRIVALCYRPTGLAITANQKLWGINITVDGSTSVESGAGTAVGCGDAACFVLNSIIPRAVSGNDGAELSSGALFGNQVTVNAGTAPQCLSVPTKKHTWGQLKSLYRN